MIKYFPELMQGTEQWFAARLGLITASEMKLLITPTLKTAANDKSRAHVFELAAQRISKYVEPSYQSDDMLRGHADEIYASQLYNEKFAPCTSMGFVTNDKWGFTIGYSPDALVGDDGQIEIKSRRQKYQVETILSGEMPVDYLIQVQTGMLVTERPWCDFISYCGGLPMCVYRIEADEKVQAAIVEAARATEDALLKMVTDFHMRAANMLPTERRIEEDMII